MPHYIVSESLIPVYDTQGKPTSPSNQQLIESLAGLEKTSGQYRVPRDFMVFAVRAEAQAYAMQFNGKDGARALISVSLRNLQRESWGAKKEIKVQLTTGKVVSPRLVHFDDLTLRSGYLDHLGKDFPNPFNLRREAAQRILEAFCATENGPEKVIEPPSESETEDGMRLSRSDSEAELGDSKTTTPTPSAPKASMIASGAKNDSTKERFSQSSWNRFSDFRDSATQFSQKNGWATPVLSIATIAMGLWALNLLPAATGFLLAKTGIAAHGWLGQLMLLGSMSTGLWYAGKALVNKYRENRAANNALPENAIATLNEQKSEQDAQLGITSDKPLHKALEAYLSAAPDAQDKVERYGHVFAQYTTLKDLRLAASNDPAQASKVQELESELTNNTVATLKPKQA